MNAANGKNRRVCFSGLKRFDSLVRIFISLLRVAQSNTSNLALGNGPILERSSLFRVSRLEMIYGIISKQE